jgi:hypothetical protein
MGENGKVSPSIACSRQRHSFFTFTASLRVAGMAIISSVWSSRKWAKA